MTKCSTMNNDTSVRSNMVFGMNSSFTSRRPRRHGHMWLSRLSRLRLAASLQPCSKVLTKHGVRGMSSVGETIYIFSGIEGGNIGR